MPSNNRRGFLTIITGAITGLIAGRASAQNALWPTTGRVDLSPNTHLEFVNTSLNHMQTIHLGMTRAQLEVVFETPGGMYARKSGALLGGTYAYRLCGNFKIEVDFIPFNKPEKDAEGRLHVAEDPRDIISSISKPYVDHIYMD